MRRSPGVPCDYNDQALTPFSQLPTTNTAKLAKNMYISSHLPGHHHSSLNLPQAFLLGSHSANRSAVYQLLSFADCRATSLENTSDITTAAAASLVEPAVPWSGLLRMTSGAPTRHRTNDDKKDEHEYEGGHDDDRRHSDFSSGSIACCKDINKAEEKPKKDKEKEAETETERLDKLRSQRDQDFASHREAAHA
ncbi:hypothetical protein PG993_014115 [Apiospora rasikravindrae]|uniref:Uncharacterized protein n=1 Tax=Apiospora rasikravindrae TaxID=990691 RepID=A0ABR1RS27_9PEZI